MKKESTVSFKHFISLFFALILFSLSLYAGELKLNDGQTKISITSSSYESVSFTANLSSIQYRDILTSQGTFTELFVPGYGYANTVGDPKLPVARKLLEVPLQSSFSINITREQYKEYDLGSVGINHQLIPAQAPVSKNITDPNQIPFVFNAASYQLNQWLGEPLVKISPVGILRSLNLGRLEISPVQYNPVTGKIRVYEILEVTVYFNNANIPATISLKKNTYSPYFNNLYNLVSNYRPIPTKELITSAPVTYVVVSPITFHDALQPLINWKKKKGFKVIEAYTDNPLVGTTTASIKTYLQNLYTNPPAGYEKPSFILFVGDVAQVPAWTTNGHPSDMYYCDYTNDNIPEVYYGRFSAQNLTQLQPYIDKTIEYEQYTMPSDSFLGEVTLVAGSDASHQMTYGNGQINYGTSCYFNSAHSILSHTYLQPEPSGGNYSQLIRTDVSNGVAFANYTAHGSEDGWADPGFGISQIPALQNNHKYCLMVGNCCKTSNFGVDCFAEEVTRASQKGALGYIGCSDYSYWDEDYWWASGFKAVVSNPTYDPLHIGAYDVTFHDQGEPISQWFVTMGQMVVGGQLAVEESSSGMKLYYWETYCLMGDPSLSVYYAVPPALTATHASTTMVGVTTFTVNTEPYAYVAMTINDTTLLDAKCADLSGMVNLVFPAITHPDSAKIVVTKQNRKPYFGTVLVIPATGPYVVLSNFTVNDSTGNNNQLADYSESLKLNVKVDNVGVVSSGDVIGTIETADTNIIITNNTFHFGLISAGASVVGNNAFSLTVKDKVADQHRVNCTLSFNDGTNSWASTLLLTLNAPVLTIGNVIILDPVPGGNNNCILDPGESATLKIEIGNSGHARAVNSIAHLSVAPASSPYILVSNPSYYLGLLDPGSASLSYGYFQVTSNGITPVGTIVSLDQIATAGQQNQYSVEKEFDLEIGQTPQYIIENTTVSTCSGNFFDSGGPAGNYSETEDYTMTFNPGTPGALVKAVFTSFDLEEETSCNYDWLKVYDGPTTSGTILGTYCGSSIPGPFQSTTGPLTFQFYSDYSNSLTGWAADITCTGGPLTLIANAFPADVCAGSSSQLVAIPTGGTGNYTYQWSPTTYLDDPTSRTPVSTPADNITYTVTVLDGLASLTSGPIALTVHQLPATPEITETDGTLNSSAVAGNQWYINGAMIPDANQPTYTPVSSGVFYVVVSDPISNCQSAPSNTVTIVMTGVGSQFSEHYVSIYPNPFYETLTVSYELPETSFVKISLYDVLGKESRVLTDVASASAGKYFFTLSGREMTQGMYYLTIRTNNYQIVRKVILNK
jgi:hypothetical protein